MSAPKVMVAYEVPEDNEQWELPEEDMPETAWHDAIIDVLKLILREWATRVQARALVAGNLALRWNPARWKVGVDPDVSVYVPPPPDGEDTSSVCTWEPGHHPPRVAVEVVSRSTAAKDYVTGPDQYAASGTAELWVFDPKRFGPRAHGGPFTLQLWRRDDAGTFRQVYRGPGPAQSPELGAWLVVTEGGTRLRLADDAEGTHLWPTPEEREAIDHERAEAERERAETERERAETERERAETERERAEAKVTSLIDEVAALRAELARLRGG
jgi:Uma2 family endonuclease